MRISFLSIMTALLVLSFGAYASAQTSTSNTFTTNLSLGSGGTQVVALQQALNRDLDTRIASTGPGSPGNETSYFGSLTQAAVIRFQEKYAGEILVPVGLTQGNGFVGTYTRAKLNTLSTVVVGTSNANPTVIPSLSSSTTAVSPQNPNLKNLDLYIAAINKQGFKQGLSSNTLSLIEDKIRKEAATTTDFRQQFFDIQKVMYEKKISENIPQSPILALFEKAISFIHETFSVEKASASVAVPFGGFITYVNPEICDCPPGITQIFVALPDANPTTSNLLLNYVDGSEAFSYYNIPEPSIAVLGTYMPKIPSCWTYVVDGCIEVPSEGQITPMVGSSLEP